MNAKEEHARNLEINRMSRNNNEMAKKNVALEAECVKLRSNMKETIEKYSTVVKQCNEKIEEMQRQFELEKERLNEQAKKEASLQRAHHFDSINEIKRQLESMYNEKATQNKLEHTSLMQQLNEEREQLKKDTETHMLQMANERHHANVELEKMRNQMKQELDEFHARIKRDEQEFAIRIVIEMDEEREKIKCQLIEERKELSEKLQKEDDEKRKKAEDEIAEMMKQTEVVCNEKLSKLEIMMQQIEKDQTRLKQEEEKMHAWHEDFKEQLKKREEEQNAYYNDQLQMLQKREEEQKANLQHELTQLKQKEDEQNKRFSNDVKMIRDERNQMKQELDEERERLKEDEHERHVQFLTYMKDEREKMKSQLEKERQQNQNHLSNEREELEKKYSAAHNSVIQRLNDERTREREQVKQHMDELMNNKKKVELEHSKTKELQLELKLEKERVIEEAKKDKEAFRVYSEEALAEKKRENECLFKSVMNKHQLAYDAAMKKLNDETTKRENEHAQLLQKTKTELDEKIKSNADAFEKAKLDLETKLNEKLEKLHQEREQIKQIELEFNAKRQQLENDRTTLFKQAQIDAAEQRKSISKELHDAKLEQENHYNEMIRMQKSEFNAQMQKLNDEQIRLNASFSKKMEEQETKLNAAMAECNKTVENEKKNAQQKIEMFQKESEAQRNKCEEELKQKKQDMDARFNAALKDMNDKLAQFNQTVENEKKNAQQKIEMFQKESEAQRNKCEEEFNEKKRELRNKLDVENSERQFAFNEAMQKLKNERTQMNLNHAMLSKSLNEECENYKEKTLNEFLEKKQSNEKLVKTALEECNLKRKHAETQIEKLRIFQDELMEERKRMNEERTFIHSEKTALAEKQNELIETEKSYSALTTSLMNKIEQLKNDYQVRYESLVKVNDGLKRRLESDKPIFEELHDAVATNFAHLQLIQGLDFDNKRIAIYSHYSDRGELESYNWLTIESIEHYFDYVFILTNTPNEWNLHSLNHNKFFLLNYNMKSDFRNYATFIMQTSHKLANASCLSLINDSFVIVDVNAFGCCIKNLFETKLLSHDFIGLTSSHENQFHVQSYFLCFNSPILQRILDYFKTTGLPKNHGGAISLYELGMSSYLINQGVSCFAFVSNNEMKTPFNTTCCKWKEVLNETGIIKRQHFLKKYAMMAMSDNDILEVAENYSYNVHFIDFLKYHNVRLISTSVQ